MPARLDHVALNVAHLDEALEFFQTVFGMEVSKATGEAPMRKIWFKQGIQLNEVQKELFEIGAVDHIAICVEDVSAITDAMKHRNLPLISGKKNWFHLTTDLVVELICSETGAISKS